jgi:hypothetical protein
MSRCWMNLAICSLSPARHGNPSGTACRRRIWGLTIPLGRQRFLIFVHLCQLESRTSRLRQMRSKDLNIQYRKVVKYHGIWQMCPNRQNGLALRRLTGPISCETLVRQRSFMRPNGLD